MKSYIDINQSKKLAEILPLESADMYWKQATNDLTEDLTWKPMIYLGGKANIGNLFSYRIGYNDLPCWSLAALLSVLKSKIYYEKKFYYLNIEKDGTWWYIEYIERYDKTNHIETSSTEELIDACYEMILKLHEQKLL